MKHNTNKRTTTTSSYTFKGDEVTTLLMALCATNTPEQIEKLLAYKPSNDSSAYYDIYGGGFVRNVDIHLVTTK